MEYINIKDYFKIIIDIFHIIKKKSKIEKLILLNYNNNDIDKHNNHDKYININYLNNTFIKIINNIAKDNLIISKILDVQNNSNINSDTIIKLSTLLCSEFYYLYNAIEMYNIIKSVITINKSEFIKNYNDVNEKLIYIYDNDKSQIKNYNLECNKNLIFEILKKVKSILKSNNI